ncbi:MAG: hypothetical protein K9N23_08980 [Akkermansiaceae bacterium]|nr:hypothetical protein [Akkermansiaceae bacterium]
MIIHLLRYELCRHRLVYPLAALLIFCARLLPSLFPSLGHEASATGCYLLLLGIGAVAVRLLMRSHPWHDDRAFWRTRPITARQLLASQTLAITLVVLIPFAAALLLDVLPLNLGGLPTSLAILLPLGVALVVATALAACAALARNRGRPDLIPYLAVFVTPLLSTAAYGGFLHLSSDRPTGPHPGSEILTTLLCVVVIGTVAAVAALLLATLQRKRRAALGTLLVAAISLPWITGLFAWDFFQQDARPARILGARLERLGEDRPPRPRWTGLADDEFFAPRIVNAGWMENGKHVVWSWPRITQSSSPDFDNGLLRPRHQPLEDQHSQFAAAASIPALWDGIRARIPQHATWRTSETPRHLYDPLDLGSGPDQPGFSLGAAGEIFRLEAIDPVFPLAPGRLPFPHPGRLEILRLASDDSQIAILLSHTTPNPSLDSGVFAVPRYFTTSPPAFWAVLLHPPSSTAYACHGLRVRIRSNLDDGMIVNRQRYILTFKLPRLETQLLGLDPRQLLAESTLHLFHATPVAPAIADISLK